MPPKGKRSKRKRKAKDLNSLRAKSGTSQYQEDTNAYILSVGGDIDGPAHDGDTQDQNGHHVGEEEEEEEECHGGQHKRGKKLGKSQQRKLRKIQEEKEKRLKRQKVLETLSKHTIGNEELNLLRSASSRGQHETKKELRKRALMMERAGIALSTEMRDVLYSTREQRDVNESDVEQGSIEEELAGGVVVEEEEEEEEEEEVVDGVEERLEACTSVPCSSDDDEKVCREIDKEDILARVRQEVLEARQGQGDSDSADEGGVAKSSLAHVQRNVVMVERTPEIEEVRSSLPIIGMEQEIMESISENDVVVLCGETGCGKTTQLPQFLYEGGYTCMHGDVANDGIIGVTQPRRVAAVSTAHRVSEELGGKIGGVVGYHVRYDRRISSSTRLQFMTDGILLRELQDDFLLKKYNVIIVDEAHERSLNTDVLLGMLSRVVKLRRQLFDEAQKDEGRKAGVLPLKLIIMSATLRIGDFVENKKLFRIPPPVINIQARQYPVAVHFQKRTELDDYVGAAYKKTCQIHRRLPDGGILVFLTGQREVETMCSKLRKTFNNDKRTRKDHVMNEADLLDGLDQCEMQWDGDEDLTMEGDDDFQDSDDENTNEEEERVEIMNGGEGDLDEQLKLEQVSEEEPLKKVWVLPLYAMLRPDQQARVFKPIPEGHRLIVVATNIAETSLTIPGIRYVVDAGRSKQRILESFSGLAKYDVRWISKASADQRAGRSGRMGPGHCYRIYSSAVFNDMFPQFSPPEIYNIALEGVVLLLKSIGVDNVMNFPFPSPPDPSSLAAAERCLVNLSAISKSDGCLTTIGKSMAKLPIEPRHARLLIEVLSNAQTSQHDDALVSTLLMFAIRLTAAMSLESPFINPSSLQDHQNDEEATEDDQALKDARKQKMGQLYSAHAKLRLQDSDHLSAMNALCAYEESGGTSAFCKENFLIFKHLREGLQLTKQLERILRSSSLDETVGRRLDPSWSKKPKLSTNVVIALKKAILAGWGDHISKRVRSIEYLAKKKAEGSKTRAMRYESISIDEDVFLHPSSSLFSTSPSWVIYSDIIRTEKRAYMVGLTMIEPQWIYSAVPQLSHVSEPLPSPAPKYSQQNDCVMAWHSATYGPLQWELPPVLLPHPDKKERAAIFAMSILDGTAVPKMKEFSKQLVVSPSVISSPEMRVHKRIYDLIRCLDSNQVYSKSNLSMKWKTDPNFLKDEIGAWVQKKYLPAFLREWQAILPSIKA